MNIYLNNKPQEILMPSSIADVLQALNIVSQKGIAIAVNQNVISHQEWDVYELKPDDKVMLIKATQGG